MTIRGKAQEEAERIRLENGGDEDAPTQLDPRSYPAKPVWQRMVIISAGVVMNVITGVLFAAVAYGYGVNYQPAIIGGVIPGGPAWERGLEPGGEVVAVNGLEDNQMHFNEMSNEILTAGMKSATTPIPVQIRYEDGVRDYDLSTSPHPLDKDVRMVGISPPISVELGKDRYAALGSVAESVLDEKDAGATLVAYDGNKIDSKAIVPGTPFFDYLFTHPSKTIELEFKRADNSVRKVQLPPQTNKTLGVRFAVGPIKALVKDGPAAKAGVKAGDVITAVNGDENIDAFGLPLKLVEAEAPVMLTLRRGSGDSVETIDVELNAMDSKQTKTPTSGAGGIIGVNRFGLAFQSTSTISSLAGEKASELQIGDQIKRVHLVGKEELEKTILDERHVLLMGEMEDWEFKDASDVSNFSDAIQILPAGSEFVVVVERPSDKKIIKSKLTIADEERFRFERGLGFLAAERTQKAQSLGQAIGLGWREGNVGFMTCGVSSEWLSKAK